VAVNPKHYHTFGCPMYLLDTDLQTGKKIDKWSDRSNIGIHIGRSPHHAKTVHLVLSLKTGLASPQFHLKVDNKFETLRTVYGNAPPKSLWQEKCHFISDATAAEKNAKTKSVEKLSDNVGTNNLGPKYPSGVTSQDPTQTRNDFLGTLHRTQDIPIDFSRETDDRESTHSPTATPRPEGGSGAVDSTAEQHQNQATDPPPIQQRPFDDHHASEERLND
jgi:hypothetical protein